MTQADFGFLAGVFMEVFSGLLGVAYLLPGIAAAVVCFVVLFIMIIREIRKK